MAASETQEAKIYVDVGANDGRTSLPMAGNPDWVVYAFEPTPELADHLRSRARACNNYHVIQKAVSNKPGRAKFNIAGQGDWGTSSLLDFNDNISTTWRGRTDFKVTGEIEVEVITLKDFCLENNIQRIDHLHADVQGMDYDVLLGLEDFIDRVQGGDIECSRNHDVKLYKNEQYVFEDVAIGLYQNGFLIEAINPNDDHGKLCTPESKLSDANELSIWYRRR
ncbi:FkbM family methyltransferase [Brevundimonas aurantiaca]|uniref:FkbM family methyltransferase n=1 Tax=Brevundimonas aurantiaca TaxID=74316 RepID=UPI001D197BB8|nr:FkbM family methyltransferase [Brevundimonas aurantiaca]MCC4294210.1 FkbM family methyltransferase [Brevundimonas aurantiaca]